MKLSPYAQNAILSRCQWTSEGKVKVMCTHHTEKLLRASGIPNPRPFVVYDVAVHRANFLLVLGPPANAPAPSRA